MTWNTDRIRDIPEFRVRQINHLEERYYIYSTVREIGCEDGRKMELDMDFVQLVVLNPWIVPTNSKLLIIKCRSHSARKYLLSKHIKCSLCHRNN